MARPPISLLVAELRRHRARSISQVLTLALGTALVVAALVLGASAKSATEAAARVDFEGADAVIRTELDPGASADLPGTNASAGTGFTEAETQQLLALPEITRLATYTEAEVVAEVGTEVRRLRIESQPTEESFRWQRWSQGRAPAADHEIALTRDALDQLGTDVGGKVAIGRPDVGRVTLEVVGVVDLRGSLRYAGTAFGVVTSTIAEDAAGIDGPNTVLLRAATGFSGEELVEVVNAQAPIGWPQSVDALADSIGGLTQDRLEALQRVVVVLAGIALLVAGVVLGATTGVSVASRRRSHALLRGIGASRSQLGALVLGEVVLLGLSGSLVGIGLGLGAARAALPLAGLAPGAIDLPPGSFTVPLTAVVVPVLAAVVLALLAGAVPAVAASRVRPAEALRNVEGQRTSARRSGVQGVAAALGAALGLGLLFGLGPFAPEAAGAAAAATAAGAGLFLASVVLGLSLLLRAAAGLLARGPMGRRVTGSIALRGILTRPGRAAAEAVPVFLACALLALTWVCLGSVQATVSARIATSADPDVVLGAQVGGPLIAAETVDRLVEVDGVAAVTAVGYGRDVRVRGTGIGVGGAEVPVSLGVGTAGLTLADLDRVLPDRFAPGQVADDVVYLPTSVLPPYPDGAEVSLTGPRGTVEGLRVQYLAGLGVPSLVSPATLGRVSAQSDLRMAWVRLDAEVDRDEVLDRINVLALRAGLIPLYGPAVLDLRTTDAIGSVRTATTALLAVALLVAVIGTATTVALSISESLREHALLRALGMDRRSLRRLLVTRVLTLGLLGVGLGITAGGVIGAGLAARIADGLGVDVRWDVPWIPVLALVVLVLWVVQRAAVVAVERAANVRPALALSES